MLNPQMSKGSILPLGPILIKIDYYATLLALLHDITPVYFGNTFKALWLQPLVTDHMILSRYRSCDSITCYRAMETRGMWL